LKVSLPLVLVVASYALAFPYPAAGTTPAPKIDIATVFEPKTPPPSVETLSACVDTALKKVGINMNMKARIGVLKDIMEKDMHLSEMLEVKELFKEDLQKAPDFGPMLKDVYKGITEDHPAIGTAICLALQNPTTAVAFGSPNKAVLTRSIHYMYLLNRLVEKLGNDVTFMENMMAYLNNQVDKIVSAQSRLTPILGEHSRLAHVVAMFENVGLFGVAKDHSVNVGINNFIRLRKQGTTVSAFEQAQREWNLSVNIAEATATDAVHREGANARVGAQLALNPPTSVWLDNENHVRYGLNKDWARLYETWNLAFITGNLEYLNVLYPKLLIPRVLLATGPAYIYERGIALWLSVSFYLMAYLEKKPKHPLAGAKELSSLWGELNGRYGKFVDLTSRTAEEKPPPQSEAPKVQ